MKIAYAVVGPDWVVNVFCENFAPGDQVEIRPRDEGANLFRCRQCGATWGPLDANEDRRLLRGGDKALCEKPCTDLVSCEDASEKPSEIRPRVAPGEKSLREALKDLLDEVAPNDGTACALCGDKGDPNCCLHVAAARAAIAAAPESLNEDWNAAVRAAALVVQSSAPLIWSKRKKLAELIRSMLKPSTAAPEGQEVAPQGVCRGLDLPHAESDECDRWHLPDEPPAAGQEVPSGKPPARDGNFCWLAEHRAPGAGGSPCYATDDIKPWSHTMDPNAAKKFATKTECETWISGTAPGEGFSAVEHGFESSSPALPEEAHPGSVTCPVCGAEPGIPCGGMPLAARQSNASHSERYIAAKGSALPEEVVCDYGKLVGVGHQGGPHIQNEMCINPRPAYPPSPVLGEKKDELSRCPECSQPCLIDSAGVFEHERGGGMACALGFGRKLPAEPVSAAPVATLGRCKFHHHDTLHAASPSCENWSAAPVDPALTTADLAALLDRAAPGADYLAAQLRGESDKTADRAAREATPATPAEPEKLCEGRLQSIRRWQDDFRAAPAIWVTEDEDGNLSNAYESREAAMLEIAEVPRTRVGKMNIHSMDLAHRRWASQPRSAPSAGPSTVATKGAK